ncbi:zf-HC2 domain-containing protein [Desulfotomaculum sp. 1211_IL3151]|uniref:zf-HC2 domain-containing protein n=1 Tax=Desulfotomaculum sp. 1211_IL3151 TaxID=3084055 RepID=UPI002FDAC621
MQCKDISSMLSPYLDGVLNSDECAEVRVHLACCPKCKAELEELQAVMLLLQELPEMTPPVDFREKLLAKIDDIEVTKQKEQQKSWLTRVTAITRSTWYRSVAVAAVMMMTLGITSLWQQEDNSLLPVPTKEKQIINTAQQPNVPNPNPTSPNQAQTNNPEVVKNQEPNTSTASPLNENTNEPGKEAPAASNQTTIATPAKPITKDKQVESFIPKPSEGLVASSTTLKLDVDQVADVLKDINRIAQNNGAVINTPYSGTNESGTLEIRVTKSSYGTIIHSLQGLGAVVSFLPVEKDLSIQHKGAAERLAGLKQQQTELEQQYSEEPANLLAQQLEQVNHDMAEQVKVIKQIEERSNYSLITVTIM